MDDSRPGGSCRTRPIPSLCSERSALQTAWLALALVQPLIMLQTHTMPFEILRFPWLSVNMITELARGQRVTQALTQRACCCRQGSCRGTLRKWSTSWAASPSLSWLRSPRLVRPVSPAPCSFCWVLGGGPSVICTQRNSTWACARRWLAPLPGLCDVNAKLCTLQRLSSLHRWQHAGLFCV